MGIDLLKKFESVEIKTDKRISERDLLFCETHQQAYDEARMALTDMKERMSAAVKMQREILGTSAEDERVDLPYIGGHDSITVSKIKDQLEGIQSMFIEKIIRYFNHTYNVSVSCDAAQSILLPQKPERDYGSWDSKAETEYHRTLRSLCLHYDDIVDQIVIQLNGRTFAERAFDELREACHKAAWNEYQQSPNYELKKDTLCIPGYACGLKDWGSKPWELRDKTKDILRGIAHFETGSYDYYPCGFSDLLGWGGTSEPITEFSLCNKIRQLRMFKNGRVDMKFADAQTAKQFVEKYLGLVF